MASITTTDEHAPLIGFDLSTESYEGEAAEVVPGVIWTMSEHHHPAGLQAMTINNRAFLIRINDPEGDFLLMSGINGDKNIDRVRALEEKLGLKLKIMISSGDWHHMYVRYWMDAFPDTRVLMPGVKFPISMNGVELMAEEKYNSRIELIDQDGMLDLLAQYQDQVQFYCFNQCHTYTEEAWQSKDGKNPTKKASTMSYMMSFSKLKWDQRFICFWLYHPATKTIVSEHNFEMAWDKDQVKSLPFPMNKMMKPDQFCSWLIDNPHGPKTPEAAASHAKTMQMVISLDVEVALDYHSLPGKYSKKWESKDAYKAYMLDSLKKTGEHDPSGAAMLMPKGGCCCCGK